jgi:succinate dehydrogenase / fumarate reductase iron-sulfur subunit
LSIAARSVVERQIAVERFDPSVGADPYWATYSVPMTDNQTVLDALLAIADDIDPTLAFRRTCRSGICGSCAGRVNGRASLFCQVSIGAAVASRPGQPLRVQALEGFTVLRDLVVDMDPFFEAFNRARAWLEPRPGYDGTLPPQHGDALWPAMSCVMCGICTRGSGAEQEPHPAVVARVLTLARDPRDARGEDRLRGLPSSPGGRFADWLRAVCPKDVDVRGLIE